MLVRVAGCALALVMAGAVPVAVGQPHAAAPAAPSVAVRLVGPSQRPLARELEVEVAVTNTLESALRVRADFSVMDRNHAVVAHRGFELAVAAEAHHTERLSIPIDSVALYLPPFRLQGSVISADAPGLTAVLDESIVMGNARVLVDDGATPLANWFTTGTDLTISEWLRWWLHAEAQRASAMLQDSVRLHREAVEPHEPASPVEPPWRGPTALRIDYRGHALVYRGADRHLPGNPYRLGLWIEGDGSGAELRARFLDYTNFTGYNWNEWKRIQDGERVLCTLDFEGWRFIEVDLPGGGLGENTPRGSTPDVDYPLEWTYLEIVPAADGPQEGTVRIGAAYVETQQPQSGMLALHVGYDDPDHAWQAPANGWVTFQNAAMDGDRTVQFEWRLTDRSGVQLAGQRTQVSLAAGAVHRQRLELASLAAAVEAHAGPYRLSAEIADRANPSVRAERAIVLARPDSAVLLADFETARGYRSPPHVAGAHEVTDEDGWAAFTSDREAHSGKRSLALAWDAATRPAATVSIDPALPGIPVLIRMWVHGDGAGAVLHPFVGDRPGVQHGWRSLHHNIFHLRRDDGDGGHAVTVDWTGWREVAFRLPPIPAAWEAEFPVLPFVPNYPLGLHLSVYAPRQRADAVARAGTLYVDEIRVVTHLEPGRRMEVDWTAPHDGNRMVPGTPVELRVRNADLHQARTVHLQASLRDWRGAAVAAADTEITLPPQAEHREHLAPPAPVGAFVLHTAVAQEGREAVTARADVIVADRADLFGQDDAAPPRSAWALRQPLGERFQELAEDWDWIEPFPGNTQFMSLQDGVSAMRARGGEPWMRLGYSAYWSAGIGFEVLQSGRFERPPRDAGHAVDVLQPPARVEDWDAFVAEVMRAMGGSVAGWLLWDGPDATSGPLALSPDFFSRLLQSTDRWRRRYAPDRPLLAGGLSFYQSVDYLLALAETETGLAPLDGVHVRMDAGRNSPEDAHLAMFVQTLHDLLGTYADGRPKQVLLTELDWAVETEGTPGGLGVFDQAAYLARAELLLLGRDVRTVVEVRNADAERLGLGLAYRRRLSAPPMHEASPDYLLKPAWVGLRRLRERLPAWGLPREEDPQDRIPGRTRCLVFDGPDRSLAVVWRLDGPGEADFAPAGLRVHAAEDLFGSPVPVSDGRYAIGRVPVFVTFESVVPPGTLRMQVRDPEGLHWSQETLAVFHPADDGPAPGTAPQGGARTEFEDWRPEGLRERQTGMRFDRGGQETLQLEVPAGAGVALRKHYVLAPEGGHVADVLIGEAELLRWDLARTPGDDGAGGLREALLTIPAAALGTQSEGRTVSITLRYPEGAGILRWTALAWRGDAVSLGQLGLYRVSQPELVPRLGRNVTGGALLVGDRAYADGIGVYAPSAMQFQANRRYRRLTGAVGLDAIAEGRGAVRFEVFGDGRRLWSSPVRTGLDEALELEIDVEGVDRLRLVVMDAADGSGMGVANWCDMLLHP